MKIWIEPESIKSEDEQLLRCGALYGLLRLQLLGHELGLSGNSLPERQHVLLENEPLEFSSFGKDEADLQVVLKEDQLRLLEGDSESGVFDDWIQLADAICFPERTAAHSRVTAETKISVEVNLDGTGQADIHTGLGFLDHMLEQITRHGLVDLKLTCNGDLEVDEHHTIEDVAIALGETISKALGSKVGVQRYGFVMPMDESRATVAMDLSGRPYLVFEGSFSREMVGDFPTEMVEHFFYSLVMNLKATLHINVRGKNDHHKIEACFKGFARCLRASICRSERNLNILPSTKDLL